MADSSPDLSQAPLPLPLHGKVAIVTGASSGIGLATALRLAQAGASVVLAARNLERLEPAAAATAQHGFPTLTYAGDLTDEHAVDGLIASTLATFGRIDLLINNAGAACTGLVHELAPADWDRMFAINTRAVFLASRAVLPSMRAQGSGHVVNIASVAARAGFPGWSAYCAAKHAVVGFSRALLEEVRSLGIRVSVLYPGGVDTPLWDTFPNDFKRDRMMAPADVAEAVCWTVCQPAHLLVEDLGFGPLAGPQ